MTAVQHQFSKTAQVLYVAFELGWDDWKLAFAIEMADNPRLRKIPARDTAAVLKEIAAATKDRHRGAGAETVGGLMEISGTCGGAAGCGTG